MQAVPAFRGVQRRERWQGIDMFRPEVVGRTESCQGHSGGSPLPGNQLEPPSGVGECGDVSRSSEGPRFHGRKGLRNQGNRKYIKVRSRRALYRPYKI